MIDKHDPNEFENSMRTLRAFGFHETANTAWADAEKRIEELEQEVSRLSDGIEGLRVVLNNKVQDINELESQRDRLRAALKTAVNQLEHVVPTVDPTMDSNDIYTTFDAVIHRCNHTKNVLVDVIREIEGGR